MEWTSFRSDLYWTKIKNMDESIMAGSQKYSYWIIGLIVFIIIISIIPWENALPSGPKVGIVEINMPITNSKKAVDDLNYFNRKSNIAAIVVRLETPGGGVAASQEIYEKVRKISKFSDKPIIASMGGVAASGGYYIALGADTIMANPGTATGSIGVIMSYPIIGEMMDKIGIQYETIKSGSLKDSGSPFRNITSEERKYFQGLIDDLHGQFLSVVAKERNIPMDQAAELANGQVYSGKQAVENGLIDMLGTFEDAVLLAAREAGYVEEPEIVYPPEEKKGLLDMLFGDIFQSSPIGNLFLFPTPEYKLPYTIR
ncbi:MAG TPA: signal peptide peptidase SppA [Candidatus Marinimicrobia bacterium]|nr:signal peptide peptidase SppA [Candidatus Neomarinimicrobiota bacterium]